MLFAESRRKLKNTSNIQGRVKTVHVAYFCSDAKVGIGLSYPPARLHRLAESIFG